MSRQQQRQGAAGEELGAKALTALGVLRLQKIATPYRRIPHPKDPAYCRIIPDQTVAADWTGILPGGRFVLAEIKTIYDRNLRWSDLREHQPKELTEHSTLGGLALLVWVNERGANVMQWPIPGFDPGKGIDLDRADGLDTAFRRIVATLL